MYSVNWNEMIKKMVDQKWNRYSGARARFEEVVCSPYAYPKTSIEEALWLKDYASAVDSEESILGDIRIAMKSIVSFPNAENISYWKRHFAKCAIAILESNPDGVDIVSDMMNHLKGEVDRLPNTVEFCADTELMSEKDTSLLLTTLKDYAKSVEFTTSLVMGTYQYMHEEQDNRNAAFINRIRYCNHLNRFDFSSQVQPIGFNQDVETRDIFNINGSNIMIPFNRMLSHRYVSNTKRLESVS